MYFKCFSWKRGHDVKCRLEKIIEQDDGIAMTMIKCVLANSVKKAIVLVFIACQIGMHPSIEEQKGKRDLEKLFLLQKNYSAMDCSVG